MSTSKLQKKKIQELKGQYDFLKKGKESLLKIIDEVEIPETVFNSNAIENSTLTLRETEKILLEMEVSRNVSLREVFEAKNLARVIEYVWDKSKTTDLSVELILLLHKMLIGNIDDSIAGRFRKKGEFVRVGTHIAPAPEHLERMIEETIVEYEQDFQGYFLDKIAHFHLNFEMIHPFNDGNGRIGRALINYQLLRFGFPSVIIRDKEKQEYYRSLRDYDVSQKIENMDNILTMALLESLNKRIVYLKSMKIIKVVDYASQFGESSQSVLNKAKRQTIPAFREKGVWKIGVEY
ncbi:Fic family protein [Patescibacteria group bacterium]|nr:Fic family protein [Patescibacteria group bacterium]